MCTLAEMLGLIPDAPRNTLVEYVRQLALTDPTERQSVLPAIYSILSSEAFVSLGKSST